MTTFQRGGRIKAMTFAMQKHVLGLDYHDYKIGTIRRRLAWPCACQAQIGKWSEFYLAVSFVEQYEPHDII